MPMGEYTDFDDCVAQNGDKRDPSAYCGAIKHKVEGMSVVKNIASLLVKDDPEVEAAEDRVLGPEDVNEVIDDLPSDKRDDLLRELRERQKAVVSGISDLLVKQDPVCK